MSHIQTILYSILSGLLPALLWLWFWLKEDKQHPEPKKAIAMTFFGGMLIVILAIPLQKLAEMGITDQTNKLIIWAAIEEFLKFGAVFVFAIYRKKIVDEPIDLMIYMITAALGFAAVENALFISKPLLSDNLIGGLVLGNMRFFGATLVHVASSACLGFFAGLVFFRGKFLKSLLLVIGFILSTALHSLFNLFIIDTKGNDVFIVFSFVWFAIIILLIMFEEIKHIRPKIINI